MWFWTWLVLWAEDPPLPRENGAQAKAQEVQLGHRYLSAATFGFITQLSLIYIVGGLCKSDAAWHEDGSALWFLLHRAKALEFRIAGFVLSHVPLQVLRVFSQLVVIIEVYVPALLFLGPLLAVILLPLLLLGHVDTFAAMRAASSFNDCARYLAILIFATLHATTAVVHNTGKAFLVMTAVWLPLLPSSFWTHHPSTAVSSATMELHSRWPMQAFAVLALWVVVRSSLHHVAMGQGMNGYWATRLNLSNQHYWDRLAPNPPKAMVWPVVLGRFDGGVSRDMVSGKNVSSIWNVTAVPLDLYTNSLWDTYWSNLVAKREDEKLRLYSNWLCRSWNHRKPAMHSFEIYQLTQSFPTWPVSGVVTEPPPPKAEIIWTRECDGSSFLVYVDYYGYVYLYYNEDTVGEPVFLYEEVVATGNPTYYTEVASVGEPAYPKEVAAVGEPAHSGESRTMGDTAYPKEIATVGHPA